MQALRHGVPGFGADGGIVIVTDGVRDDDKREAWHPGNLRHGLRCRDKAICDNRRGQNAILFGTDGIVQTAR